MVEHRTENSGVRGSNPFIGIVLINKILNKKKLVLAFLQTLTLPKVKIKTVLIHNIIKLPTNISTYLVNLPTYNVTKKLNYLTNNILEHSILKKFKKIRRGKRRAA